MFNLVQIDSGASPADVFRTFLMTAKTLRDEKFDRVYLSTRGRDKFSIGGDYFQSLGIEYESQNPVYTVRTFPEHVSNLDGSKAFPTWEGGVLGVATRQIQDFNDFCHRWIEAD